jgi:cell division protein YceG involved in septum cleavage
MTNEKLERQIDIAAEIRKKNEAKESKRKKNEDTKKRMSEWRQKKRMEGYKAYELWLTEEEFAVVTKMIELFRKNKNQVEILKKEK